MSMLISRCDDSLHFGLLWGMLLVSLSLNGCVSDDRSEMNAIVSGNPQFQGELFTYKEVVRISSFQSEPDTILYHPAQRYFTDLNNHVYIADNGTSKIYKFDFNGDMLGQFGGNGQGPGEFQSVEITSVRNDRITVFDASLMRSTVFSVSGDQLGIFHAPIYRGRLTRLEPIDDNRLVCTYMSYDRVGETLAFSTHALVVNPPQNIVSEVSVGPIAAQVEGGSSIPFSGRPIILYSPIHGLVSTSGEKPTIDRIALNETLLPSFNLKLPRTEVDARLKTEYERAYRKLMTDLPDAPSTDNIETFIESLDYPRWVAFWNDMLVDDFGFFWLRIPTSNPSLETVSTHIVVNPEGVYLGTTVWPAAAGMISNAFLCTWDTDQRTGDTSAVVYKIESAIPGMDYQIADIEH